MAAADCNGRLQFVVACGVLSQCVKAAGAAAGKVAPAAAPHPYPTVSAMLLMPGADVAPDANNEEIEAAPPAPAPAALTIIYGGRVLVFDDVPADTAAEMARVAARQDGPRGGVVTDFPVARKASLQRFMLKRQDRLDARAPYATATASKKKAKQEGDAGC